MSNSENLQDIEENKQEIESSEAREISQDSEESTSQEMNEQEDSTEKEEPILTNDTNSTITEETPSPTPKKARKKKEKEIEEPELSSESEQEPTNKKKEVGKINLKDTPNIKFRKATLKGEKKKVVSGITFTTNKVRASTESKRKINKKR